MNINKDDFDGNLIYGGQHFHVSTGRNSVITDVSTGLWGEVFFKGELSSRHPRDDYFEIQSSCPCCGSENILSKLNVNGLIISQCNDCLFGFQNPRIKAEKVPEIYQTTYVMDSVYSSTIGQELDRIKFRYGIELSSKYLGYISSALDVGCGQGLSLDVYAEYGVPHVFGVDPGKYTQLSEDPRITSDFMHEVPSHYKGLSLITLWDTLEHIHDFKRMLRSVFGALKKDGGCLVMVPNFLSLATRLMRERSPVFQIDHIHYFSEFALSSVLEECGFEVLHKETVISEIDNCRNYLEFKEPYFSTPSNNKAFDWLTPHYIHSNMMGSRLLFIAIKR